MRVIELMRDVSEVVEEVSYVLAQGGVAAIPTDTSYGLAADATSPEAVAKVFCIKRRPLEKPISVFVSSVDDVRELCVIDDLAERALALLPGRVTLILKAKTPDMFPPGIVGPGDTIGIRLSPHPIPTLVAAKLGRPITATSANISGERPIYDPRDIRRYLPEVDILVDAGILPQVPVSTIIDLTTRPPRILRKGPVKRDEIERVLGVSVEE